MDKEELIGYVNDLSAKVVHEGWQLKEVWQLLMDQWKLGVLQGCEASWIRHQVKYLWSVRN